MAVIRHLDAAHNLARWLLNNDQDAEDVVQDAALRAFHSLRSFRGSDGKAWFLAVVRNTSFNRLRQRGRTVELKPEEMYASASADPEELAIRSWESEEIRRAMDTLPVEFRELVVLRELEEMSYKEIASVTGLPLGTVMSRLSRARRRLQEALQPPREPS